MNQNRGGWTTAFSVCKLQGTFMPFFFFRPAASGIMDTSARDNAER